MKIYDIEKKDGLSDIIQNNKVSYVGAAAISDFSLPIEELQNLSIAENKVITQLDLHPIEALLVSTNWNLNDDILEPFEVWSAKNSPINKQFNYGHNEEDIIGHMTASEILVGELPSLKTYIDDKMPDTFHIKASIVLYKYWKNEELQNRMNSIIDEIPQGKWYVSMEALFDNFDYGIITPNGENKIIPRNSTSAYLTKYLRCFGGSGLYNDNKIGRLLRNITFRGCGLVEEPANPNSIIFNNTKSFFGVESSIEVIYKENKQMSDKLEAQVSTLESQLAKANDKIEALTKQLVANDAEKITSEKNALQEVVNTAQSKINSLETELAKANESVVNKDKELLVLSNELSTLKVDIKTAERVNTLISAGLCEADAKIKAKALCNASDEIFQVVVSMIPSKKTEEQTQQTQASSDIDDENEVLNITKIDENEEANLGITIEDNVDEFNNAVAAFLMQDSE